MAEKKCKNCSHFLQHYTLTDLKFRWVYCGHCCFRKVRHKSPDTAACENFEFGEPNTQRFADKAYLTKELLNCILRMDLLPDILEEYQNIDKKTEGTPKG